MKKFLLSCMMLLGMGGAAYAEDVKVLVPDQEFTSVDAVGNNLFVICNLTDEKAIFNSDAQNLQYDEYTKAFSNTTQAYYWQLESLADNADESVKGCYLLKAVKADGTNVQFWGHNAVYLNSGAPGGFNGTFVLANGDQLGTDVKYGGVWTVEYVDGKGFTLKNKARGGYFAGVNPAPTGEDPIYWNFCTLKESTIENPIEKGSYDATDAKELDFTKFKSLGGSWIPESKTVIGNCGFQWDGDGIDLSEYQFIVITVAQNLSTGGYPAYIKDKNGVTVQKDEYGASHMNMWFGQWNNHNCMKIDLEKLRIDKLFDIHHITELGINGNEDGIILANAYASNQQPNNEKNWGDEDNGDFKVSGLVANQFGTICLPYQAAVAGAKIYEIASSDESVISLAEVSGLMDAGKPYIYQTVANKDANKTENTVYFYKATAATVEPPVENNGLIGTFSEITAPEGDNFYVLSNNKLYYTTGATVTVGANKAYVDVSKIVNKGGNAKVRIAINENATGVESVEAADAEDNGKIFDLSGREVKKPTKGMYLKNKKVYFVK